MAQSNNELSIPQAMESSEKEGDVTKLLDVEKTSDTYTNELFLKITDLRQKLNDEKLMNGQLQEIMCGLQGRIAVHYQRSKELDIENFQNMMDQAKEDVETSKQESEELSRLLFSTCRKMLDDVGKCSSKFEDSRIQFQKMLATNCYSELESARCEELRKELSDLELKMKQLAASKDEISKIVSSLGGADVLMEYFVEEVRNADEEIADLNQKLHAIQPDATTWSAENTG